MKNYRILLYLISMLSDGKFHSRESIKKYLNIRSDTYLYRYIDILKEWGVDIFSFPKKGFRLLKSIQFLNEKLLLKQIQKGSIIVVPIVDSTNQYLLDRLDQLRSGDVCLAEYQRSGRGRYGRQWFSSFGSNLCFSIYWNFKKKPEKLIGLSLMIGIVVTEILHKLGAYQVQIKWPNDLYILDRKLAGILIEIPIKNSCTTRTIIGIGINLSIGSIEKQQKKISDTWIGLQEIGISIDRNMLAIHLIKELRISLERFEKDGLLSFLPRWTAFSNCINRPVKLSFNDKEVYGISRGINEQGALILEQYSNLNLWTSGEISF